MVPVVGEALPDGVRIGAAPPIAGNYLDIEADTRRKLAPERRKMSSFTHQHPVTRRQGIDQRRFPGARTGGGVNDDRPFGLEHGLQPFQHLDGKKMERRTTVVDDCLVDGPENPLRHIRRPRDLQKMSPALIRHG